MNPIALVAHRGYCKKYPENTLLALATAIQGGARFIETDVQLSRDLVPVLYHDRDMRRISNLPGAIYDYPFNELVRLPAYEPQRFGDNFVDQKITPLADLVRLLQANPQVHAFVEIKRCAIRRHGIETLYNKVTELLQPVADRATLISFSLPFVEYAAKTGWHSFGPVIKRWSDTRSAKLKALRPAYIFCDEEHIPARGTIGIPGCLLVIYEIDDPQRAIDLHERGADMIETFAITELQQSLTERFNVPV